MVVTIDPAKRLADALGLAGLTGTPSRIEGDWPGELWAMMLDTKTTFDALVVKHAATPEQGRRILANRFYRNISGALSGTQEYMAMEKLYELHDETDFELVVVDTPPTRHTLDFLDTPRRLSRFLDHRLFRLLIAPGRGLVKAVNVAAQTFLRTVSKVVGGDVVDDAIAFFQAFEGMEEGFRQRAARVNELLAAPETAFVLVASPRRDTVEEAHFFADRLGEAGIDVQALVVNRVHPSFSIAVTESAAAATAARAATLAGSDLGGLYRNLSHFQAVASREQSHSRGWPARWRRRRSCGCRSWRATSTTWRAWTRWPPTCSGGPPEGYSSMEAAASSRAAAASSSVSFTGTMRSNPVVWSRRVRVGRLQATATSPPAPPARRMPPISAPRPAESMNGTGDRSISRSRVSASSPRASRNCPTV